jgi:hypothetical protein
MSWFQLRSPRSVGSQWAGQCVQRSSSLEQTGMDGYSEILSGTVMSPHEGDTPTIVIQQMQRSLDLKNLNRQPNKDILTLFWLWMVILSQGISHSHIINMIKSGVLKSGWNTGHKSLFRGFFLLCLYFWVFKKSHNNQPLLHTHSLWMTSLMCYRHLITYCSAPRISHKVSYKENPLLSSCGH